MCTPLTPPVPSPPPCAWPRSFSVLSEHSFNPLWSTTGRSASPRSRSPNAAHEHNERLSHTQPIIPHHHHHHQHAAAGRPPLPYPTSSTATPRGHSAGRQRPSSATAPHAALLAPHQDPSSLFLTAPVHARPLSAVSTTASHRGLGGAAAGALAQASMAAAGEPWVPPGAAEAAAFHDASSTNGSYWTILQPLVQQAPK